MIRHPCLSDIPRIQWGNAPRVRPQVPEFRVSYAIVTDKLDALYQQLKPKGVTMTALLAKAAGVALAKHPLLYAGEGGSAHAAGAWSGCGAGERRSTGPRRSHDGASV